MTSAACPTKGEPAAPGALDPVPVDADLADDLPEFLASRRALVVQMRQAIDADDREELRQLAHRGAGSFSLYGFAWAAHQCQQIELQAAARPAIHFLREVDALHDHLTSVRVNWRAE